MPTNEHCTGYAKKNSVSTQHSFIFLKPEVQSNPIKGEQISYFLHIDSGGPKNQKLSDQQITPIGSIHKKARGNPPKNYTDEGDCI